MIICKYLTRIFAYMITSLGFCVHLVVVAAAAAAFVDIAAPNGIPVSGWQFHLHSARTHVWTRRHNVKQKRQSCVFAIAFCIWTIYAKRTRTSPANTWEMLVMTYDMLDSNCSTFAFENGPWRERNAKDEEANWHRRSLSIWAFLVSLTFEIMRLLRCLHCTHIMVIVVTSAQ